MRQILVLLLFFGSLKIILAQTPPFINSINCDFVEYYYKKAPQDRGVITYCEKMPSLLLKEKEVNRLLTYADSITYSMFTGKVFLGFIVDTIGNKHCIQVLFGSNDTSNFEAKRILNQIPFTPGSCNGKKKNMVYCYPVDFSRKTVKRKNR